MTLIIPLGEECYTCGSIDSKFNSVSSRTCAFPFDYVGHVFIEQITEKCRRLLSGDDSPDSINIKLFGDNYFFSDTVHGFHYWHDTSYTDRSLFTASDWSAFRDKYKRRYDRLIAAIRSGEPVLCISVNHYDNIYKGVHKKESIVALYELLRSYNPNLSFLAINYDRDCFTHGALEHVTLPYEAGLPFADSKVAFTATLNSYMIGKIT